VTGIFVHLQLDPKYYAQWNAGMMSHDGVLTHQYFERWDNDLSNEATLLSLSRISITSLYVNYLQVMCMLLLIFLAVREFLAIIRSVQIVETFHQRNISAFQKIGKYFFLLFILSGITIVSAQEAHLHSYSLQLTPLILSVVALIMAEIFRQGNKLLEENQLTI
jgi:hypothetical protein